MSDTLEFETVSLPTGAKFRNKYILKLKLKTKIYDDDYGGSTDENIHTKFVEVPAGFKPENLNPDLTINLAISIPDYIQQFNVKQKYGSYCANGRRGITYREERVISAKLVKNKQSKNQRLFTMAETRE